MNSLRTCPKCAAPLPADAPQGHCPQCLLSLALEAKPGPDTAAALELDITVTARNATGESQPTGAVTAALP